MLNLNPIHTLFTQKQPIKYYLSEQIVLFINTCDFDRSTMRNPWSDISKMHNCPVGDSPNSLTIFRTAWQTTPVPLCARVSTDPRYPKRYLSFFTFCVVGSKSLYSRSTAYAEGKIPCRPVLKFTPSHHKSSASFCTYNESPISSSISSWWRGTNLCKPRCVGSSISIWLNGIPPNGGGNGECGDWFAWVGDMLLKSVGLCAVLCPLSTSPRLFSRSESGLESSSRR